MTVRQLSGPPSVSLARALAEFEAPFTYPLGPGRSFSISHGEDYSLFFRAQGQGSCFIAEHQGRVIGVLGTAIRRLWMPDGSEIAAAYFGDLKIAAEARGGAVLLRLARAAEAWLRPKVQAGFGVVMGGTSLAPETYTGRAGIPKFQETGRVAVLRVCGPGQAKRAQEFLATQETGLDCYRRLSVCRYACPTSEEAGRSQMRPLWLVHPQQDACGMLEDTRKAKRLLLMDGSELLSAHLSCFAFNAVSAGAELINVAVGQAAAIGLPAVFVAVPAEDAENLRAALPGFETTTAPATVYGTGLATAAWNINSSEI